MSGAKRRSGYRKGLTDEVLHGLPEPQEGQCIVKLLGARGSNLFEVESERSDVALALLPTKFRKTVWVKRGDFCIVTEAERGCDTSAGDEGSVRYMIDSVLYPPAIKHLRSIGRWPAVFDAAAAAAAASTAASVAANAAREAEENDEEEEEEEEEEEVVWVNRNRQGHRGLPPSDSEGEEEEEEEQAGHAAAAAASSIAADASR
jgi:probable RNA-binding protein EIF1AD